MPLFDIGLLIKAIVISLVLGEICWRITAGLWRLLAGTKGDSRLGSSFSFSVAIGGRSGAQEEPPVIPLT